MRHILRQLTLLPILVITGCGVSVHCSLPPSITGQPSNQTVAPGERALFTVAATGSVPLTYQWLRNGTAVPGATQPSYLTPTTASAGSSFKVDVSNSIGNLTSTSATLLVDSSGSSDVRFVAPSGDDSNAGTIDRPYRTIQHCATTIAAGGTCEIRTGTYRETVTPNSGITLTSYNFEPVVVDGSDPVAGWSLYKGSIYKANATLSAEDTNQVFVGNDMMTEARWPNGDDLFHVNWATAQHGTDTGHIVDKKLPAGDWTGAKIHLWSGSNPFGHETGSVTASDSGRISIDVGQTATCPWICPAAGGYYYLFGTLSALDVAREWFYDSGSRTLYLFAPGGVDPNTLNVRFKKREHAFDLRGKVGVTIRNIAIFATTIVTDDLSVNNVIDRIDAKYVSHFTSLAHSQDDPDGSGFSVLAVHVADSGIMIFGKGNILRNSTIAYSAGNGVAIEGENNTVENNLIHDVDYVGDYDSGILLDGHDNTIQHNTVYNTGRQAILFDGVNSVTNQDIGRNNLFNSMMLSRDGAAIYACCSQVASGTRIHHNWIHDTQSSIHGPGDGYAVSGVYIDNGSGGFNVDQNVLWKNQRFNIFINGLYESGSKDNNLQNNTIPDASSDGYISIAHIHDCSSTRVIDNRVVIDVKPQNNGSVCEITNNRHGAPGATEMLNSTDVGCNFAGCSTSGPPAILDAGSITPCPVGGFPGP